MDAGEDSTFAAVLVYHKAGEIVVRPNAVYHVKVESTEWLPSFIKTCKLYAKEMCVGCVLFSLAKHDRKSPKQAGWNMNELADRKCFK